MKVFLVAGHETATNSSLLGALRELGLDAELLRPGEASRAGAGDVAILRLDVRPTLDGVESGFADVRRLARAGARLLNRPGALVTAHDKLATALRLGRFGLPHPQTRHLEPGGSLAGIEPPVVVKPRFGSWGRDVSLCSDWSELERCVRRLRRRPWFRRQGVLVQELVPPVGHDLRLIVAAGEVVGAVERVAAPGEWRTNVALGGIRRAVSPPPEACAAAISAASALGADLVGVDLLPSPQGGYVILELNGAADFTPEYSLDGLDVFERAARALGLDELPIPLAGSLSA